jgi:hypothetical protein
MGVADTMGGLGAEKHAPVVCTPQPAAVTVLNVFLRVVTVGEPQGQHRQGPTGRSTAGSNAPAAPSLPRSFAQMNKRGPTEVVTGSEASQGVMMYSMFSVGEDVFIAAW